METNRHIGKNIGFVAASLLLWVSGRVFHVRVFHGQSVTFDSLDVAFVFLPPLIAFFLNWYWLREQRMDALIKWAVSWASIDLAIFLLVIAFASGPLKQLILSLQQTT